MRVLLLNPKRRRGISYTVIPNVGLGHLAEVLRRDGHEAMIVDANKDGIEPYQAALLANDFDPHWIGITTFSPFLDAVCGYVAAFKSAVPERPIVLGGPHPTFEPEQTLQYCPEADFAVVGEGEPAMAPFCNALESKDRNFSAVPNLVYRQDGGILQTERCFVNDLDRLGPPAWDLIRPDTYPLAPNGIFSRAGKVAPIIATRGCPYPCTFCGAGQAMGKKLRSRSARSIRDEMQELKDRWSIGEIHFMDDNFTQDRGFVEELCQMLIDEGPHMPWACPNGVRLDRIDEGLARQMEQAGCYSIAVGIEFGTDRILKAVAKNLDTERIRAQVMMIKKATNIRLTGFFILGHPEETEEDLQRTIDFSLKLPLDRANFFNFTPFPGSRIYQQLKERGALDDVALESMYIHSVAYHPDGIDAKRLGSIQARAHLRFYLRPRILRGILREIKGWAQLRVLLARVRGLLFPGK